MPTVLPCWIAGKIQTAVPLRQEIEYTDFPLNGIELYLCDGILMLKNEY